MRYSLNYVKEKVNYPAYKDAVEFRSNNIDSSVKGKEWLLTNPSQITKIPNVTYCLNWKDHNFIRRCVEENIPFMIEEVAQSWEYLYFLVEFYKVSQVRIGGELGFQIDKVCNYCHKRGIKVRLCDINKPSSVFAEIDPKYCFWLPPQAMEFLDKIDMFEITDREYEGGVMNCYKLGKWYGDGAILTDNKITGFDLELVPTVVWETRLNCERRCFKGKNCKICENGFKVAEILQNGQG